MKRIVCAAMRNSVGDIVTGARHYDGIMHQHIRRLRGVNEPGIWSNDDIEQGFIDQYGNFYNRQEAWKIAEASNQIIHRCGGDTTKGGTLFSENLY